jgi:2',3'-cyclic-nucleotide 2'-phosphodiesterase
MISAASISILFLGDVIGKPGRCVVREYLDSLENKPDLIIANVENAAHGFGVSESNLAELREAGVSVFSGGNHTFDRKEIFEFIDKELFLLRPANYPEKTAGRGFCLVSVGNIKVAVLNLMGRVFMEPLRSPFLVANDLVLQLSQQTNIIVVDMHAEATAEKIAMGLYLDGRVCAVIGTHTHVQTADERILPGGTAYITDAGCCGPTDGVIGMDRQAAFRKMIEQLPTRLEVASGPAAACGVMITIDCHSGKAIGIERVRYYGKKTEAG